jgi:uncharacterized protein YycO
MLRGVFAKLIAGTSADGTVSIHRPSDETLLGVIPNKGCKDWMTVSHDAVTAHHFNAIHTG